MSYYIGTSGFTYEHWRDIFYPPEVPAKNWLEYYARHFSTVEINSSFYHLPKPSVCDNWKRRTPENFTFAVKASRFITHIKRLKDCTEPIARFFGAVQPLGEKCGPILFQLPPGMKNDIPRLEGFLKILPAGYRYVFEFRNKTWYTDDLFSALDTAGIGFCIHDLPDMVSPLWVTGSFVYVRFHGAELRYSSPYNDEELASWAGRMNEWAKAGKDIYAYFNNDAGGYAVENAKTLIQFLNQ